MDIKTATMPTVEIIEVLKELQCGTVKQDHSEEDVKSYIALGVAIAVLEEKEQLRKEERGRVK